MSPFLLEAASASPSTIHWIHSFTITDAIKTKQGYTCYKITSIVFPRAKPQALTCLTVWKRFHDIRRLHRELSRRHKNLKLPGQLPPPTDCSFFKRFDAAVIERRKAYILQFLDRVAQHAALYKCHAFTQFFSDVQAGIPPLQRLHEQQAKLENVVTESPATVEERGAIAEIRDKLGLQDNITLTLLDPRCDKPKLFTPKLQTTQQEQQQNKDKIEPKVEPTAAETQTEKETAADVCDEVQEDLKPNKKTFASFLTPMPSIESDDSDYIYEAALEFSHAVQAEANLEYAVAHARYKHGVEVLLNGAKEDANDERRFIAKAKIAKYLARADDIFNKYLAKDALNNTKTTNNFQLTVDVSDDAAVGQLSALYLERPWNHLAKYKVMQVLNERVMQVQCITEANRPAYVMKGIEKPSQNSATQSIFLPQHVPYMVDLLAFFQSDQKLFLLLKQAEGGCLYEYLQKYTPTVSVEGKHNLTKLFPNVSQESVKEAANITDDSWLMEDVNVDIVVAAEQNIGLEQQNEKAAAFEEKVLNSREIDSFATVTKLPEASLKQWARELAVAIHSLHGKGVILGDLHMGNLLLGAKGQLMLSYFYQLEAVNADDEDDLSIDVSSTEVDYIERSFSPFAVAGQYVAPERPLTFKSDWWSYGVVLYQLLTGVAFKAAHPGYIELYGCVQYPENVDLTAEALDLLDHLLQQKPEARLDYEQLEQHAFFAGTNWSEVCQNGLKAKNFK